MLQLPVAKRLALAPFGTQFSVFRYPSLLLFAPNNCICP
jgi:hypothetical protein